jgi:hypothetical protein
VARPATATPPNRVTFNRLELNRILNLYGRMVADGEWRDYAIDFLKDRAVFRYSAAPPKFRFTASRRIWRSRASRVWQRDLGDRLILRRGHELERVLLVIDRKLAVV